MDDLRQEAKDYAFAKLRTIPEVLAGGQAGPKAEALMAALEDAYLAGYAAYSRAHANLVAELKAVKD